MHKRFKDRKGKWVSMTLGGRDEVCVPWGFRRSLQREHIFSNARLPCPTDRPKEVISDNLL